MKMAFKGVIGRGGKAAMAAKEMPAKGKGKKKGKKMPPMPMKKRPDMGALAAFAPRY